MSSALFAVWLVHWHFSGLLVFWLGGWLPVFFAICLGSLGLLCSAVFVDWLVGSLAGLISIALALKFASQGHCLVCCMAAVCGLNDT